MKVTNIVARDLNDLWFQCMVGLVLGNFTEEGELLFTRSPGTHSYYIDRGSFKGQRRLEFDYVTLHVKYPGTRPLVPDVPGGCPVPCTQEYIDNYLPYLFEDVKTSNEDYTYGQFLKPQIPKIIEMYKESGYGTNQAFMAVGNEKSIFQGDPPCLRGIDTRIQDGKLHFEVYFRSWDLWGGLPGNLGGIQILKEYMASEIGVEDGELIASSKGLHLYEHVWKYVNLVLRS